MLKKRLKSFFNSDLSINSSKVVSIKNLFILAILFTIYLNIFELYLFKFDILPYWVFRVIGLLCNIILLTALLTIVINMAKNCENKTQELEETISNYDKQSKEEENLNQIIIDNLPVGLILFQEDGTCPLLNEAIGKILGGPLEKIKQINYANNPIIKQNGMYDNIKKTFSSNIPCQAETHNLTEFGKEIWISYHLVPLVKNNQKIMLMIMEEISENRYLQASIKRSETKFRAIFENASDGFYLFKPNGLIVDINNSALKLLGYSKDELLNTPVTQFETPEYAETFHERMGKVLSDGHAEYTVNIVRKDKSIVVLEVKASVISEGEEKYILIVSRDITDRKNEELKKQKELLHLLSLITLLQNNSNNEDDLIAAGLEEITKLTDSQYACIYEYDENLQMFTKSSWSKETITDCSIIDFRDKKTLDNTGIWGEAVRKRQSIFVNNYAKSTKGTCPDGHVQLERFLAVPVFHKGSIAAIVGVANKNKDYTSEDENLLTLLMTSLENKIETLRKSNDLLKLSKELKQTNANLEDFTYIASHDLKEPLRSISNYSSFLLEDYSEKLDDEGNHMLNVLIKQSQRMEQLIDVLLKYSRISKSIPDISTIDLNTVLNEVSDDLSYAIKNNNVDIKIEKSLPSLKGNRLFVKEIYSNLISNAIKYNNKDEKLITIGFLENSPEGQITLFVKDNGIGIPEKHFENVFKIFKRLHSREDFGGGTGAGLTIVKKMIEIHKGNIWIESIVNKGTTFYFTFGGQNDGI